MFSSDYYNTNPISYFGHMTMTQIIPHQWGVFPYPKKYPISRGYFHTPIGGALFSFRPFG